MPTQPVRKTVNALVPGAPLAMWAKLLIYWAVYPVVRAYGGLWVGGTATLADGALRFAPNRINLATLAEDVSFTIPLGDLAAVRVEKGMGTDIIVLATAAGERRIRCYAAGDFAAAIGAARAAG